jgi:hypothetical protein
VSNSETRTFFHEIERHLLSLWREPPLDLSIASTAPRMVIKPVTGQFQSIKILRKWHTVPSFKGSGAAVKDYRPLTRGATLWVRSVAGARDLLKVIRASSGVNKNQLKVCQGDCLDSF